MFLQRTEIRRDREDVVIVQTGHGLFHQLRVDAVSRGVFEQVHLPRDVNRMQAGQPRHVAQPFEVVAVTDGAGKRLAAATCAFPFCRYRGSSSTIKTTLGI